MRSVAIVIVTEKTSHIDIFFLILFLLLFWCCGGSSSTGSWGTATHSGHLGKTSSNHF